jgi:hypothetical protein
MLPLHRLRLRNTAQYFEENFKQVVFKAPETLWGGGGWHAEISPVLPHGSLYLPGSAHESLNGDPELVGGVQRVQVKG